MQEGGPLESHSLTECRTPQASSNTHADSSSSSGKCKKRERTDEADKGKGDNYTEEYESPQKRECLKVDDIASVTDEDGRLPDIFAVDQLIRMMREAESCTQRGMLSDSLVSTLKEDCLQHFVRMGGVMILDDWLQDGYKAARSKDADTAVEKVVAMILQALEKLPINLELLKGCSIGKSVNHLRSHKNGEIQKKARKLVDAWKKRVDFEMKHNSLSTIGSDNAGKDDSITCSARPSDITDAMIGTDEAGRPVHLQEGNSLTPVLESAPSTKVASPNLGTVTLHKKSDTMNEKDTSNNKGEYCPSSLTSLLVGSPNDGENEGNNTSAGNPASCKNEASSQGDHQHSEGKHSRGGNNNSKNDYPNGLSSSSAASNAKERTNEYRKKLRSSGSKTLPSSSDSHSNTVQENKTPEDDGAGSQKQLLSTTKERTSGKLQKVESLEKVENMSHDLSATSCTDKKDNAALKDEKVDSLTRTSSCTEKQKMAGSNLISFSKEDAGKFTGNDAQNVRTDMLQEQQERVSVDSMLKFTCSNSRTEMKHDPSDNSECKFNANPLLKKTHSTLPERGAPVGREPDGATHIDITHMGVQPITAKNTGELRKEEADGTNEAISCSNKTSHPSTDTIQTSGNSGNINLEGAVSHLRLSFDLNEGFAEDEFSKENIAGFTTIEGMSSSRLSTPVAVIAATKGAFVPPANVQTKSDVGWKGSAATSAFRPAPLKSVSSIERQTSVNQVKNVNNFDLNVPDQDIKEDGDNYTSRYRKKGGGLDLNFGGEDMETDIQASMGAMQVTSENRRQLLAKPVLDFDLNEGPNLEDVHQEQVVHTSAISRWCNNTSLAGSNMPMISREMPIWNTPCTTFPAITINIPGRSDLACMGPMASQNIGLPQRSTNIVPPLLPSEMYSQAAPFFGGMSFISSSPCNPTPIVSEPSFMVPKVTTQAFLSRNATSRSSASNSRPSYVIDLEADVRGSNSFYKWGRQDQNAYDSTGPTTINYKDIGVNIKDHKDAGVMSMEEQMRLYHQAAVPVTSLKRKDSDYSAFPQSTWR